MNWSEYLEYRDGNLFWIKSTSNRASIGNVAGCNNTKSGYVFIGLLGKTYLAHRIVWEMHNGDLKSGEWIDHINMSKSDNRIENLRICNFNESQCNKNMQSNNTSGYKGVTWNKNAKKWKARVQYDGKEHHIGYFDSALEAYEETVKFRNMLHKKFARHS